MKTQKMYPYLSDDYGRKILIALEKDGKKPFSTITVELDIPHTMVGLRVNRFKKSGILKGNTIILDEAKINCD